MHDKQRPGPLMFVVRPSVRAINSAHQQ